MTAVDQLHVTTFKIEGDHLTPVYGPVITGVHQEIDCHGMPCPIHSPTRHHMRNWQLHWDDDRRVLERMCPHGVGHPDPDQVPHWRATGRMFEYMHRCDGCCGEREARRVH